MQERKTDTDDDESLHWMNKAGTHTAVAERRREGGERREMRWVEWVWMRVRARETGCVFERHLREEAAELQQREGDNI